MVGREVCTVSCTVLRDRPAGGRLALLVATAALLLGGCGRDRAGGASRGVAAAGDKGAEKGRAPGGERAGEKTGKKTGKKIGKKAGDEPRKEAAIDVKALAAKLGKGYYPVGEFWAMYKPAMDSLRACKGDPEQGIFTAECTAAASLALRMGQTPSIFKPPLDEAAIPAHFDRLAKDVGERLDTTVVGVQRVILTALFNKKLAEHPALRPGYRAALRSPEVGVAQMAWHRLGGDRAPVPAEVVRLARAAVRDSANKPAGTWIWLIDTLCGPKLDKAEGAAAFALRIASKNPGMKRESIVGACISQLGRLKDRAALQQIVDTHKPRAASDNWARTWSGSAESLLKSL